MLTKFDVVSVEVVDLRLGEHRVVFKFSTSDRGAVVRDQDQLRLSLSQSLQSRLVTYPNGDEYLHINLAEWTPHKEKFTQWKQALTEPVLAGLDDKGQLLVHVVLGLLLSNGAHCYGEGLLAICLLVF